MVLVTGNWRIWLVGLAASLTIFLVTYFAVIAPSMNTANQALKSGLQQTQQAVQQAQQQLSSAGGQASPAAGQAQQTLGNAAKLTTCLAAAGTDSTKLQACQAKYAN
jgi:peptidoglycan hydrolase CwlO-like protein